MSRRQFALSPGVNLGIAPAPDEMTILRFRHMLERHELGGLMLKAVNIHLQAKGIRIATEFACAKADIDHRLTKPKHPWTNGQVERMNRTLKEATVKRFYYETHEHLRRHLTDFAAAYNFARRLKTLKGPTP